MVNLIRFVRYTASAAKMRRPHTESSHVCTAVVRRAGKIALRRERLIYKRSYVCEDLFWQFLLKMCHEDFQP